MHSVSTSTLSLKARFGPEDAFLSEYFRTICNSYGTLGVILALGSSSGARRASRRLCTPFATGSETCSSPSWAGSCTASCRHRQTNAMKADWRDQPAWSDFHEVMALRGSANAADVGGVDAICYATCGCLNSPALLAALRTSMRYQLTSSCTSDIPKSASTL